MLFREAGGYIDMRRATRSWLGRYIIGIGTPGAVRFQRYKALRRIVFDNRKVYLAVDLRSPPPLYVLVLLGSYM